MGAVAKATHLLRRAPVALKFMSPAVLALQGAVERFVNEGVAASQIDSDHVVKVFDVGRMPSGAPYLVMEFLDGQRPRPAARARGRPARCARAPCTSPCRSCAPSRRRTPSGIIHRDMKPSNCFVINKDGEPDFVKLVDFGISKVRTRRRRGPVREPHAHQQRARHAALHVARAGALAARRRHAHATSTRSARSSTSCSPGARRTRRRSGEFTEILFKIFTTDPEPLRSLRPDVPDGLAAVVHRALVRDPNMRFSSAVEMAEALTPFADERSAQVIARLRGGRGRSLVPADALAARAAGPASWAPAPAATREHVRRQAAGRRCARRACRPTWASRGTRPAQRATQAGAKSSRAALIASLVTVLVAVRGRGVGGRQAIGGRALDAGDARHGGTGDDRGAAPPTTATVAGHGIDGHRGARAAASGHRQPRRPTASPTADHLGRPPTAGHAAPRQAPQPPGQLERRTAPLLDTTRDPR